MKNLAFHSSLKWNLIKLLILSASLWIGWENVPFELESERVRRPPSHDFVYHSSSDRCGDCVGGTTGKVTITDCAGDCGNASFVDDCDYCQRRGRLVQLKDCHGVCKGRRGYGAKPGCNQVCVGGSTGKPLEYGEDSCGKCGGNNETCTDCNRVVNGDYLKDSCEQCKHPNDSTFNSCVKITWASPIAASARGGRVITIQAAGLNNSRIAKCWFENEESRSVMQLKQIVVCLCSYHSSFASSAAHVLRVRVNIVHLHEKHKNNWMCRFHCE